MNSDKMSRREPLQQPSKYVAAEAPLASAPDLMAAQSKNKDGPIFVGGCQQLCYNSKARYLPISQIFPSHKYLNKSDLQKNQNLAPDSVAVCRSF
ncbi:MAG: hypothetical protein ACYTAO_01755 [Planctomycetota bacterium]|jgi:hypothetical protein